MEYWGIINSPVNIDMRPVGYGSINGGILKKSELNDKPKIYITVQDIDKTLERIKKLGGEIILEKSGVANVYIGLFKDTEGNVIGLWEIPK